MEGTTLHDKRRSVPGQSIIPQCSAINCFDSNDATRQFPQIHMHSPCVHRLKHYWLEVVGHPRSANKGTRENNAPRYYTATYQLSWKAPENKQVSNAGAGVGGIQYNDRHGVPIILGYVYCG